MLCLLALPMTCKFARSSCFLGIILAFVITCIRFPDPHPSTSIFAVLGQLDGMRSSRK